MLRSFFIVLLLLPLTGLAQFTISGKVLNLNDKKPVADASVFLNNAIVGTKTNDSGTFILNSVRPGQYDLVISIVGFETFHQAIMVNSNISLPDLEILPKTILLNEVTVKPDPEWGQDYEMFKPLFLGNSLNALQCKILNPDLLDLDYDHATHTLTAKSNDFLEIENKALGYKIKYLLTSFTYEVNTGMLYFEGSAFFENLKGRPSQQRRWGKSRLSAYDGSSMHFLRSIINNTIEKEGFKVLRLIREPNPAYVNGIGAKYLQTLVNIPLSTSDFAKLTDIKGQFALGFKDCLYIMYSKKNAAESTLFVPENDAPGYSNSYMTTIITFAEPYAFFDYNGIVINPRSIISEGVWGKSRIAELLPVDYLPSGGQK